MVSNTIVGSSPSPNKGTQEGPQVEFSSLEEEKEEASITKNGIEGGKGTGEENIVPMNEDNKGGLEEGIMNQEEEKVQETHARQEQQQQTRSCSRFAVQNMEIAKKSRGN